MYSPGELLSLQHEIIIKTAADAVRAICDCLQVPTSQNIERARNTFDELMKENSIYSFENLSEVTLLIPAVHQLVIEQLQQIPVMEKLNPLLEHNKKAEELYFIFLQKTIRVKDASGLMVEKPILSLLPLIEAVNFYIKAGQSFLDAGCYQESAWYWGVAYRWLPSAEMKEKITQLATQLDQICSEQLFESNQHIKKIDALVEELNDLLLTPVNITEKLTSILQTCHYQLEQLFNQEKEKYVVNACRRLSNCLDSFRHIQEQSLQSLITQYKGQWMDLMNRRPKIVPKAQWLTYGQQLKTARENLLSSINNNDIAAISTSLASYNQKIIDLLKQMSQKAMSVLGDPPGKGMAIAVIGSLSREDASPQSDIDLIIIKDEAINSAHPYYLNFIHWLTFTFQLLGEPWTYDNKKERRIEQGLHIDGGILSRAIGVIQSPAALAKRSIEQDFQGLYRPLLVYATENSNLYLDYQTALAQQLALNVEVTELLQSCRYQAIALKDMKRHATEWQKELNQWKGIDSFEFKKHLLAPLTNWILDMALYWKLIDNKGYLLRDIPSILKALENKLDGVVIHCLQEAWKQLQYWRLQFQISTTPSAVLTDCYEQLEAMRDWLLKPLWQSVNYLSQLPDNTLWKPFETNFQQALSFYEVNRAQANNPSSKFQFDMTSAVALLRLFLQTDAPLSSLIILYRQIPEEYRSEWFVPEKYRSEWLAIAEDLIKTKPVLITQKINFKEEFLPHLLASLNRVPNQDGWRPLSAQKKQAWEKMLYPQLAIQENEKANHLITLTWPSGKNVIQCLLSPTLAAQLFLSDGKINEANRVKVEGTPLGRRIVIPLYNQQKKIITYAKFYPEFPGIQAFVNDLSERLEGSSAQATLVQIQHPKIKQAYPVLFSQPLSITLFDELKNKGTLQHLDDELDPYFYSLTFLKELALLLEDNKEDNIGLAEELNPAGVMAKRLISFDSDHALVEPLIERNTLRGKEEKVNAKSIVFCFKKKMQSNIDPQAMVDFLNFKIKALLKKTAESLQQRDRHYVGAEKENSSPIFPHFADYVDEKQKDTFCCLPTVFEIGSISHLYQRLLRMQSALQQILDNNQRMTHLAFFKLIEPPLAAHFEKALNQHEQPEVIFHSLPTEYVEKAIAKSQLILKQSVHNPKQRLMNSLTVLNEGKRKDLRELIKEKKYHTPWHMEKELDLIDQHYEVHYVQRVVDDLYQGNVQSFIELGQYAYDIKEQVIAKLEWDKIQLDVQAKLLGAMQGTRFYDLNLKNCQALTDTLLQSLLKTSRYLQKIDISGCEQLTNLNPLSSCPLRVLIAPHLSRLKAVGSVFSTVIFPQLKYLSLKEGALQTLRIQATLLQELIISDCQHLQSISLQAPELQLIEAMHCSKLSNISQLDAPKLLFADFSYCQNLRLANMPADSLTETKLQMQGCHREFATYFNNRGNAKYDLKDYVGAMADFDQAIALNPKEAEYFIRRCIVKFHLKDYAGAITDFDQAIALDPTEAIYFNGRGNAKFHLKDYAGAITDFDQAIALDPTKAIYFNGRGNAKSHLKDYVGAIADYDQAIALDPTEAVYFNSRGNAKSNLKDYVGAIVDFDQAIALDPTEAVYFNSRGNAKSNLKDYVGAIVDFDQAIALDPKNASYFNNRGIAKSDLYDYVGAIADYDQAIALNPTEAAYFNNRGLAKSNLKDYVGEIVDFDQAIALDPTEAAYFNRRGVAKTNLKDYVGARADYDQAKALNSIQLSDNPQRFFNSNALAQNSASTNSALILQNDLGNSEEQKPTDYQQLMWHK